MDPYERKLSELKGYVPFLERMISRHSGGPSSDPAKTAQLAKMKSLHNILTDPTKRLQMETLNKCGDVLQVRKTLICLFAIVFDLFFIPFCRNCTNKLSRPSKLRGGAPRDPEWGVHPG